MSTFFDTDSGRLISCRTDETEIVIPMGIRIIGENVFKGMRKLEKVTLPHSLEKIETGAFKGCMSLNSINFPDSLSEIGDHAFHRCHALRSAILPDSVKKLGKCSFLYCDGMESVSIGGIKRLERQTFANCTGLREIRLNSSLETDNLGDDIFTGCVNIKKIALTNGQVFEFDNLAAVMGTDSDITVQSVAKSVYHSMKLENGVLYKLTVNLKEFSAPEGIYRIEKSCFYNKKGISRIILPHSLREIGANAFGNCINLEEVIFSCEDVKIDGKAFKGSNNLEKIILNGTAYYPKKCLSDSKLPSIVRRVGEQILSDFYISGKTLMSYRGSEERICVPEGITVIGEGCFENNDAIGRIILPRSVREICENAFKGCVSLQTAELSEELESIEKGAFENCKKLLKITLPPNIKYLGESSFKRCTSLAQFDINNSLENIGDMAFYGCTSLKSLDIPPNTAVNGSLAFYKSGIGNFSEAARTPAHQTSRYDIPPYKFCKSAEVHSINTSRIGIIGKYAYSGCPQLCEIVIDDPECVIGEHAFEKCTALKSVKLNVKSIGKGAFAFCPSLKNVEINGTEIIGKQAFMGCSSLYLTKLSESVSELGDGCFDECVSLKSISLYSVKLIGERAFSRCEGLEEITLSDNICVRRRAFEDCCYLKRICLSSNTRLKSGAFFGCTNVTEIVLDGRSYFAETFSQSVQGVENPLPDRVQEITASIYSCFRVGEDMTLLKYNGNAVSVKIPCDIAAIGDEAFRNCIRSEYIEIPESVGRTGKLTFAGSGWLERMREENNITVVNNMIIDAYNCGETAVIPAEIKRICSWAFAGNTRLREVIFQGGRTAIDEYAFRNCIGLKRITDENGNVFELTDISSKDNTELPAYVRRIFSECVNCFKTDRNGTLTESTGNIKDIVFVNGIKAVGEKVYKDCNLLCSIILCTETEIIGDSAFENSKWLKTVGNAVGVKRIGSLAFCGCGSLEEIELSDSLEYIGKRAFEHCCSLRSIIIPEGVLEIPERAFFRCKSLKRIVFPSTLKIIGKEAFAFCTALKEVMFLRADTSVGSRAFAYCRSLNRNNIPESAFEDGEA